MKKIIVSLIITFAAISLINCNRLEKKSNAPSNTAIQTDSVSKTPKPIKIIPYQDYAILNYKFKYPDTNFIFFAAKDSIFVIDKFNNKIGFILAAKNLTDFFVKENTLVYTVQNKKMLEFYKTDIRKIAPKKVFSIDTNKFRYMNKKDQDIYGETEKTNIMTIDNDTIILRVFYFIYQGEPAPSLPSFDLLINTKTKNTSLYTYDREIIQNKKEASVNNNFKFLGAKGLLYKGNVIIPIDTLKKYADYGEFSDNNSSYYSFSPDKHTLLWIIETYIMEGELYDYYYINLDTKKFVHIPIAFNYFMWVDKNTLLYVDNNSLTLSLISADLSKHFIKSHILRFMPQYNSETLIINF